MRTHTHFFSASLRPPIAFWTLPSTLSALPSASSLASPVALPTVSLTEPLIFFAGPAIRCVTRLVIVPVAYETLKFAGYKVTLPGGTKEGLKTRTAKILVQEYNAGTVHSSR
jgi:hypothetical protein